METEKYQRMFSLEDTYWWFRGKHDIVISLIRKFIDPPKTGRTNTLILGCGTGAFEKLLDQSNTNVVSVDYSIDALSFLKSRGGMKPVLADMERALPFMDDIFNLVVALDVVEHLNDPVTSFREMERVMAPGGIGVVTVPAFMVLWSEHDEVHHHKRRFTRAEMEEMVRERTGLQIVKSSYFNFFLFPLVLVYRVIKRLFNISTKTRDDFLSVPRTVGWSLYKLFSMEKHMLKAFDLPVGVSILLVFRKNGRS